MKTFTEDTRATFRSANEVAKTKELDITTLNTEASTEDLLKKDPFMYYSVFKPTGSPAREAANHVTEMQRSNDGHPSMMVKRKTRISVECDVLTALQEMFEQLNGGESGDFAGGV
jgi:hypothetical protein